MCVYICVCVYKAHTAADDDDSPAEDPDDASEPSHGHRGKTRNHRAVALVRVDLGQGRAGKDRHGSDHGRAACSLL